MNRLLAIVLALVFAASASAQPQSSIRLNQVGFYPEGPKLAVIVDAPSGEFTVRPAGGGEPVFTGDLARQLRWFSSGENVRKADFSDLTTPGEYVLEVEGIGTSYPFEIRPAVHESVARTSLKGYYYQRASVALPEQYAGPWAREAGHPDTRVVVHSSAATASRPAGTVLSSPRGWYDAGDYNKYIVNSGISVGTLLAAYEWNPEYLGALDVDIPESGNGIPDILDEALWNIRWMLTMQDEDGGVYHKLTTANFSGEVMPNRATATRYVVQKGTAATLDFAAVMAQGARVFAGFEDDLPGLADSLETAGLAAWAWARANPNVRYSQNAMNEQHNPDIRTGEYGDGSFDDEFDWAAMEFYLTTRADSFLTLRQPVSPVRLGIPGWPNVRELGYHSLLAHREDIAADVDTTAIRTALLGLADRLKGRAGRSAYGITMENSNFYWGSNSEAANHGILFVLAYRLTGDTSYLDAATHMLDYLLGRNATGYSFLTGTGARPPMHIHHRPSRADGVRAPVPGLLAGGPNPGQQDGCSYPSDYPAKSYVDTWCSYASNEITINWNAPLVYLAASIEAMRSDSRLPTAVEPEAPAEDLGLRAVPNPFQDTTSLRVSLSEPSALTIRVLDVLGREVRRPVDAALFGAGEHTVSLDSSGLAAGTYIIRAETASRTVTQSVTLAR